MSGPHNTPAFFTLWVGSGSPRSALLAARGIELSAVGAMADLGVLTAMLPDLVVLGPDATEPGAAVLEALEARGETRVAIVGARISGATFFDPAWSAEETAEAIAGLAASVDGPLPASVRGDALEELVTELAASKRAAVLCTIDPPIACVVSGADEPVGPLAALRSRADVSVRERPRARTSLGGGGPAPSASALRRLKGGTVVVIADEAPEALVEMWSALGMTVKCVAGADATVDAVSALDPLAIVFDERVLSTAASVRLLLDAKLATAALLIIDGLGFDESEASQALSELYRLSERELDARERLELGEPTIARVEALGSARWLRLASKRVEPLALEVRGAEGIVRVLLSGGRVVEATFHPRGEASEARDAMQMLLAIRRGTVLLGEPDEVERGRALLSEIELPPPPRPKSVPPPRPKSVPPPKLDARPFAVPKPGATGEAKPAPSPRPLVARPAIEGSKPRALAEGSKPLVPAPVREGSKPNVPVREASKPNVPAPVREASKPNVPTPVREASKPNVPTPVREASKPNVPAPRAEEPPTPPAHHEAAKPSEAPKAPPAHEPSKPSVPAAPSVPTAEAQREPDVVSHEASEAAPTPSSDADRDAAELEIAAVVAAAAADAAAEANAKVAATASNVAVVVPVASAPEAPAPVSPKLAPASLPLNVLDAPRPLEPRPPAALMPADLPPAPVITAKPGLTIPPWVGVVAVVLVLVVAIAGYFASRPTPPPVVAPIAPPVHLTPDAGAPDAPPPDRSAEELAALLVELEATRESRDYPRMQSLAESALAIDERITPPTHPAVAAHLLAVALFRQRRAEEAIPWAERAIEWGPEEGESRLLLGDILAYRGSFPRARRVFQDCVDELPLYRPCRRRLEDAR